MNNNLTENLQTIKTAFEDIKNAIENKGGSVSECASVSEYASAINELPANEYTGTFIIFKQSLDKPDSPQGGTWTESGFEYPYGWSPTQKSRSSLGKVWMSFATIIRDNPDISWSDPVQISGEAGNSSSLGILRIDGILYWTLNGELLHDEFGNKIQAEGVNGMDANSAFTSYVFTRSQDTPGKPQGGNYVHPYPDNDNVIWLDHIPAGEWSSTKTYTSNSDSTPYVLYNSKYYILQTTSSTNNTPSSTSTDWKEFTQFEALFAKVGLIDNGTFGSAVFNGDYMFSQYGIDQNGTAVQTADGYKKFNASAPYAATNTFRPNVCINFKTGEAWFGAGKIKFNSSGSGYMSNGKFSWGSNYISVGDLVISDNFEDCNFQIDGAVYETSTATTVQGYAANSFAGEYRNVLINVSGGAAGTTQRIRYNWTSYNNRPTTITKILQFRAFQAGVVNSFILEIGSGLMYNEITITLPSSSSHDMADYEVWYSPSNSKFILYSKPAWTKSMFS